MKEENTEGREKEELTCKVKVVLRNKEDFFGPGVAAFLLKIQETGSILAACKDMNMSYSKGWKMINRAEDETGIQFLIRKNGGKNGGYSELTPEGERFVQCYYALLHDVKQMTDTFFEQYYSEFL